ncbi:MAG: metallophosphoesterase family protein [Proteobacteria bacterium]|nr:metallophosphoesterase family protein [Pseudomonadota bacterium]
MRILVPTLLTVALLGCRDSNLGSEGVDSGDTDASTDTGEVEPGTVPACGLLVNGDAETGDLTGWDSLDGAFTAVGASGSTPTPISGDYQFFAGSAARSVMAQTVDVSDWAAAIDEGGWTGHVTAHVRDWDGDDKASLRVTALDEDGAELQGQTEGPFTASFYRERRVHQALPAGTRQLRVDLIGERESGNDNDAYFDKVDLCIDEQPPPTLTDLRRGPWLNFVTPSAISVLWETQGDVTGSVEYSTDKSFDESVSETLARDHHEVRLTGLEADTTYHYRVLSDDAAGEIYSFRTAPASKVAFDFAVWGDNQDGPETFVHVAARIAASPAEFAVSVGDIVQNGDEGDYRDQLLAPLAAFASDRSFLVAAGNHERYGDSDGELFDLHLAQPGDEHCFGWSYAGAFFLFIDTELDLTAGSGQHQCIAAQLASPEFAAADVQFALFHYPPRIEFWTWYFYDGISIYDGDDDVRETLEPMFADAGVDLVFNGHNHLYNYTPAGSYSSTAWVTTGGGGGGLDNDGWRTGTWDGIALTHHEHHFLEVHVDGKTIDVTARRPDGFALHEFTVQGD